MITTQHVKSINRTSAIPLLAEGWHALLKEKLCVEAVMVFFDDQAVLGFVDGEPVGVISFTHIEWLKQIDIRIGYVQPRFRNHGVYKAMWSALVDRARDLNAVEIVGTTHTSNAAMRGTANRLGREEGGVILRYAVTAP